MTGWEEARDWTALEYIASIGEDSYDFVARDVWFKNGEKADLVRYRSNNYMFDVVNFFEYAEDEDDSVDRAAVAIDSLKSIGRFLSDKGIEYRGYTKRTDNIRGSMRVEMDGRVFFDPDANREELIEETADLIGGRDGLTDYEELRCKR
ncbi:MAG: hypothetical protein ABEJ72_01575 [Candidatus Aenigmatarchaeota archaeon]